MLTLGLRAFKGVSEHDEGIRKALDAEPNGPVPQVGLLGLRNWVVVVVNDLVEVDGGHLRHLKELLEIKGPALLVDKLVQGDGSQVAKKFKTKRRKTWSANWNRERRKKHGSEELVPNSDLVWGGVLNDLGAEVRALDGPKMLLV